MCTLFIIHINSTVDWAIPQGSCPACCAPANPGGFDGLRTHAMLTWLPHSTPRGRARHGSSQPLFYLSLRNGIQWITSLQGLTVQSRGTWKTFGENFHHCCNPFLWLPNTPFVPIYIPRKIAHKSSWVFMFSSEFKISWPYKFHYRRIVSPLGAESAQLPWLFGNCGSSNSTHIVQFTHRVENSHWPEVVTWPYPTTKGLRSAGKHQKMNNFKSMKRTGMKK